MNMEEPQSTERQEPIPIRELLKRIDSVENLLVTRKLMLEIATGRIDPRDTDTLAAIDERIAELNG